MFRNNWLLNVVIRSCNDEERILQEETWDKCKNMKREKRASRSAKSQLCRCELFTELLVVLVVLVGWQMDATVSYGMNHLKMVGAE